MRKVAFRKATTAKPDTHPSLPEGRELDYLMVFGFHTT